MIDSVKLMSAKDIIVKYNNKIILNNINLDIYDGEFLSIVGPSGSGKSTLLRVISGVSDDYYGSVSFDKGATDISFTDVIMVWQSLALFPHLSVFQNVEFGLAARGEPKLERRKKVLEMCKKMHLDGLEERSIKMLSGGEQQRVALARSLVMNPRIVLLDEPFASLDYNLRINLLNEVKRLQRELCITFVMVTHDHYDALSLSNRIILLNKGEIIQQGSPETVFDRPNSGFVAKFLGTKNVFDCVIEKLEQDVIYAKLDNGHVVTGRHASWMNESLIEGMRAHYVIHSKRVKINSKTDNIFTGILQSHVKAEGLIIAEIDVAGIGIVRLESSESINNIVEGHEVSFGWNATDAYILQD